jgi:hypothetical protein
VLFFFELFLPEGLLSADSSPVELVPFSARLDFLELFAPVDEVLPSDGDSPWLASVDSPRAWWRPVVSLGDAPPRVRVALLGELLALALGDAVAAGVALAEAVAEAAAAGLMLAEGEALVPAGALGEA